MAHDSQIVGAKENLLLSYGGPSQWHASGTYQRIKVYARAVIYSEDWPTIVQLKGKPQLSTVIGFITRHVACRMISIMFLKGYPLEAKTAPKNLNQSVHISWARLASFCHLGVISDPLIVSMFHNETHVVSHSSITFTNLLNWSLNKAFQQFFSFYKLNRHKIQVLVCLVTEESLSK